MHTPQENEMMQKTNRFMDAALKELEGAKDNRAIFECPECHAKAIIVKEPKSGKFTASCYNCQIKVMN